MTPVEYLQLAVSEKLYKNKLWLFSAFAKTINTNIDKHVGVLIPEEWGYTTLNSQLEVEEITSVNIKEPLFRFTDKVIINPTIIDSVSEEIETSIGTLLFNLLTIHDAFGNKIPYINGRVDPKKIEALITPILTDTPLTEYGDVDTNVTRSNTLIYVDEYLRYIDNLQFLSQLSQLSSPVTTSKTIVAPKGIKEFKEQLIEKYDGKLDDPIELSNFESELLNYDNEYLKDDPTYGKFMSGKVKNTARKKMFLTLGAEHGFKTTIATDPVLNSLDEGWPTDKKQLTNMFNELRAGSVARGTDTIKGGVSAKVLLRAGNNFTIEDTDCGSTLGIRQTYTKDTIKHLVHRYYLKSNTPIYVENIEQARALVGESMVVRSPMYCKLENDVLCKVCAGADLSRFPDGLTIPLTEISGIILAASLAQMHAKDLKYETLDLEMTLS